MVGCRTSVGLALGWTRRVWMRRFGSRRILEVVKDGYACCLARGICFGRSEDILGSESGLDFIIFIIEAKVAPFVVVTAFGVGVLSEMVDKVGIEKTVLVVEGGETVA